MKSARAGADILIGVGLITDDPTTVARCASRESSSCSCSTTNSMNHHLHVLAPTRGDPVEPDDAPNHASKSRLLPSSRPIVFLVDDDARVRESLERMIRFAGWQVETFACAREFLARPRARGPSCLVSEVALRDLDGLDLQQRVTVDRPDMPVIFITGVADVPTTVKVMKAGAVELLVKPFDDALLLAAIRIAMDRSHIALRRQAETRVLEERFASLSPREREVMRLVVAGLLNKQVGAELGISEITVKAHRGRVMRKMRAGSLAHLVTMAAALRLGTDRFELQGPMGANCSANGKPASFSCSRLDRSISEPRGL
jgi:RNA polymerase sigma factor (sigma-70 family)